MNNLAAWEIFSNDGNLRLNGLAGSLPGNESTLIVMPTGSVPGNPPANHLIIGEPYDITASGAIITLEKPAVLTLHYDATLVNGGPRRAWRFSPGVPASNAGNQCRAASTRRSVA